MTMTMITTSNFYLINTTDTPDRSGSVNLPFHIISIVVLTLVSVFGVLGNGVVIWVTGFKMKKSVNTVWYLNLAAADFIFTAFLPLKITSMTMDFHWPFGKIMCKLNTTLLLLNMFVSVYILVVMSVDRCMSVVWPVWAQNRRNVRKASCVSLCVWVVAVSITAPSYLAGYTQQKSKDLIICFSTLLDSKTQYQFHLQAFIISFFLGFVIPFTVIVSCYAVIIRRLRRNRTLASQSRRSFKIITAIIVTFFLCWAPAYIMNLIKLVRLAADSKRETLGNTIITGSRLTNCLAALNSCMNPVLYVFIRQDFKDQVKKSLLNVLESAFQEEEKHSPTEDQMEQQSFEY